MSKIVQKHYGGSFAKPITDQDLVTYKQLADSCTDPQSAGYMRDLIKMMEEFRKTPKSTQPGTPHLSGRGTIIPLEPAEIKRIDPVVPWASECDLMGKCFAKLPVGDENLPPGEYTAAQLEAHANTLNDYDSGRVRNAAYHLLWYARELTNDREPITTDTL